SAERRSYHRAEVRRPESPHSDPSCTSSLLPTASSRASARLAMPESAKFLLVPHSPSLAQWQQAWLSPLLPLLRPLQDALQLMPKDHRIHRSHRKGRGLLKRSLVNDVLSHLFSAIPARRMDRSWSLALPPTQGR